MVFIEAGQQDDQFMTFDAPRIGITTYAVNATGEIPLPHQYVRSVRRAGGIPLLIAPGEDRLEPLLSALDGLVLAGGGDICPSRYGGRDHPTIYHVDEERDASELKLLEAVLDRRLPTLAICRGLQILNVARGGTLHAHLPDVVGEAIAHRAPPREPTPHRVELSASSRLASIMQTTQFECLSWHHQAVDRLGAGCQVAAHAPDKVIEALEIAEHPQLMAVQWHPELTSHVDATQQRLFDHLVQLAAGEVVPH